MTRQNFPGSLLLILILVFQAGSGFAQKNIVDKDSIVYHITFRDTIIYQFDTVRIRHFVHFDTLWSPAGPPPIVAIVPPKKKMGWYNPNSWGIGPMLGAYYSPYHGFDMSIGFGIQYYLFAVPSFRNPHMGSRKHKK